VESDFLYWLALKKVISTSRWEKNMGVFKLGEKRKMKAFPISISCNNTDTDWNSTGTKVYQLDPGWVLTSPGWEWQEQSRYGKTSLGINYAQPNSVFTSYQKIASVYDELIEAAYQEGLAQYGAELKQRKQQELENLTNFASSHRAVFGEGRVKGEGFFGGGSSIQGVVWTHEIYVGCTDGSLAETKSHYLSLIPTNSYKVITITNKTDVSIHFNMRRRVGGNVTLEKILPGGTWWWWIQGVAGYQIKFDYDLSPNNQYKTYRLNPNRTSSQPTSASAGKKYVFKRNGNTIDLFAIAAERVIQNGVHQDVEVEIPFASEDIVLDD
jgi:hypothetical protein